jgi:hypothetical protein
MRSSSRNLSSSEDSARLGFPSKQLRFVSFNGTLCTSHRSAGRSPLREFTLFACAYPRLAVILTKYRWEASRPPEARAAYGQRARTNCGRNARLSATAPPSNKNRGRTVTLTKTGSPSRIGQAVAHRSRMFTALAASSFFIPLLAALPASQNVLALDRSVRLALPAVPPLPPPRPHYPAETEATLAIPQATEPAPAAEAPRQPRSLPTASRGKMHACGQEWQKMKETGTATGKTWFEFAQVCLVQ